MHAKRIEKGLYMNRLVGASLLGYREPALIPAFSPQEKGNRRQMVCNGERLFPVHGHNACEKIGRGLSLNRW
jgi:hypothetical protein